MLAMTSDFHGGSRKCSEIRDSLARIAAAGFTHVHWCHEWTRYYQYSIHEMLQIREWCDELGLGVKGVHASSGEKGGDHLKEYGSPNNYNRLAGMELIRNRVDLAHILDAQAIVLHLPLPWSTMEQENDLSDKQLLHYYKTFDELEPYCKTRHIRICIENGAGTPPILCGIWDALCRRYDKDYFGFCIDTGHACGTGKENELVYAERYCDRLYMIHIHDNHGDEDEHLIPFEGIFNWEGFAKILARSPYQMPIIMEPGCKEEGDDSAWLKKAFDAGNRFTAMVEKYR